MVSTAIANFLTCELLLEGTLQGVCSVLEPLSSASSIQALTVRNPIVICDLEIRGILKRDVSCMALKRTQAEPKGMAVCETFSLTSYTVNLILDSPLTPSLARKLIVLKNPGLLLL